MVDEIPHSKLRKIGKICVMQLKEILKNIERLFYNEAWDPKK